ncbi:Lymphocyte function-associated antigen 3, partial [Chelonia mydas]
DQESVFAIVGEEFTFSPKFKGAIREITWMKRKNKVAEWESGGLPTYFSSFEERGQLDTSSGNLTIKKLNLHDAAEYEAQVLTADDNQLQYTKFVFEVLALREAQAELTGERQQSIHRGGDTTDVRYSWYRDDIKIIHANNPVLELKENANPSEKVFCIKEVSKTKINDSISLSACFSENYENITKGNQEPGRGPLFWLPVGTTDWQTARGMEQLTGRQPLDRGNN